MINLPRFRINLAASMMLSLAFVCSSIGQTTTSSNPCELAPGVPSPPKDAATIVAGSGTDDTTRVQTALDQLKGGKWLVLQPGNYRISQHLNLGVAGVTLYGVGATLNMTNADDGALLIEGDNISVYGLTVSQTSNHRLTTPWGGGISVYDDRSGTPRRVFGTVIQNNTINYSGVTGIFLYKASGFTVAGNYVYRSWADGIHMTGGSRDGHVVHNKVRQNGDDMIAVVSYAGLPGTMPASVRYANWSVQQDELDSDIYIAANDVSDQYSGRGISVVGGTDVTIEDNLISKTAVGAGVYLTRETSYYTFGDHDILVRNNVISDVQTDAPTYIPAGIVPTQTHHGGIEIAAEMLDDELSNPTYATAFSTNHVALIGNQISNTRYDGIRAGADTPPNLVSQVLVQNNQLTAIGNNSIVDEAIGYSASTGVCTGNSLAGVSWGSQCNRAVPAVSTTVAVPGASLQCDAAGHVSATSASRPLPPSAIKTQ